MTMKRRTLSHLFVSVCLYVYVPPQIHRDMMGRRVVVVIMFSLLCCLCVCYWGGVACWRVQQQIQAACVPLGGKVKYENLACKQAI
jgi:hypothetical protein